MPLTITIEHSHLRAASLFASKDETRYVLNGVLIQIPDPTTAIVTATDGRRLFSMRSKVETEGFTGPEFAIVPRRLISTTKSKPKPSNPNSDRTYFPNRARRSANRRLKHHPQWIHAPRHKSNAHATPK